jgi:ADP-ribosylglycohydrolase
LRSIELKDKFIGCMLGTHVGDALGMPVEGYDCKAIEAKYGELREMLAEKLCEIKINLKE